MARTFTPVGTTIPDEFYMRTKEAQLEKTGEWVQHINADNVTKQWVFMTYQYVPADASIRPDFVVDGSDPKLFGLVDHFENTPSSYKRGHSGKQASGSQFEIKGFMYFVKKVYINHRGYITIVLSRADKCTTARVDFYDDVASIGCPNTEEVV